MDEVADKLGYKYKFKRSHTVTLEYDDDEEGKDYASMESRPCHEVVYKDIDGVEG